MVLLVPLVTCCRNTVINADIITGTLAITGNAPSSITNGTRPVFSSRVITWITAADGGAPGNHAPNAARGGIAADGLIASHQ